MEQKILLLSIMVVGMISSAALAVAPIGPPVAGLAEGQYSAGLGYAMADLEVEIQGAFPNPGRRGWQNAEVQAYYAKLGYGISDTWCAEVTLGMSGLELDADKLPVTGKDFDGDDKFMFGLTTKKTLHDNGTDTKWGAAFQYMRGGSKDTITSTGTSFGNGTIAATIATIDIDWYMIQLAMGPSIQLNPDICVYGGPFLMFIEADLHANDVVFGTGEGEVSEKFQLGGYIGTMINLGGNAGLNLEFLLSSQSWGAGIGATFPL
jgi:opacity protein-like surface antigen